MGSNGYDLLSRRENPRWQVDLAERLAADQPWAVYSADLEPVVWEFLDHHGDLAVMLRDVALQTDPAAGAYARAELRKMLLAVTLLLERIDAIEHQAADEAYQTAQLAATSVSPAGSGRPLASS